MKNPKLFIFSLIFSFIMLINSCSAVEPIVEREQVNLVGSAMEPNYFEGDIFYVYPIASEKIKRGDIVIFWVPWGYRYLRRVVGLPGERVEILNGELFIDGSPIDEPYRVNPASYSVELMELGENEYYVLGDNRDDSEDSHTFGPIPYEQIMGVAISEKTYVSSDKLEFARLR